MSELWLYNTMSKQKELFRPKVAGKVGMYVCGVTAYDLSHIGHARVYVCFDVLYRFLSLSQTSPPTQPINAEKFSYLRKCKPPAISLFMGVEETSHLLFYVQK